MTCLRCGAPMYRVVNQDLSNRATCATCCQWVDCAKCSKCEDLKCISCYNKIVAAKNARPKLSPPIIKHDEDPS